MRKVTMPSGLTLLSMDAKKGAKARPPVLCVHGMFGGAWQFEGWLPLLAERGYEAQALDLRGHHGSRPVRRRRHASRCATTWTMRSRWRARSATR